MENNRFFGVGIDLCDEYSQVAFFNHRENDPVSVDFTGLELKYQIPTVVSKMTGREEWYAGDEALKCAGLGEAVLVEGLLDKAASKNPVSVDDTMVMPIELIKKYLDYLLRTAMTAGKTDTISRICITLSRFNISILNIVAKALNELGYERGQFEIISHKEAFIYYTLNQKPELWKGDVMMFDYSSSGLSTHRMYIVNERGARIVMVQSEDFSDELPFSLAMNKASIDLLDARLREAAVKTMDRHNVTSVFLIGRGFSDEIKLPDFIKYVCDRKRVFAGQNLYAKGACFAAVEGKYVNRVRDYLLACSERITTGVEMKISDRGRDKILRMIRPGVNWFGTDCSYDFIVDDVEELEFFLSPVDSREKQLVRVSLEDFPKRPNKATRITVSLSFTSDSRCHLMVKDRGFGEFFTSSGRVINEELLL